MPRKGYKSVTLKDEDYQQLEEQKEREQHQSVAETIKKLLKERRTRP